MPSKTIIVDLRCLTHGELSPQPSAQPSANVEMVDRVRTWIARGHIVIVTYGLLPFGVTLGAARAWIDDHVHQAIGLQAGLCEHAYYSPTAHAVLADGRLTEEQQRVWRSPLAKWLAAVADDIEFRDPDGEMTMGLVALAQGGHTEVHLNEALHRSEIAARGLHAMVPAVLDEMFDGPAVEGQTFLSPPDAARMRATGLDASSASVGPAFGGSLYGHEHDGYPE